MISTERSDNGVLPYRQSRIVPQEREPSWNTHLSAPGRGRQLRSVLPVAHPADQNRLRAIRQPVKADGAVVVLAIVRPPVRTRLAGRRKLPPVEVAEEILLAGAALRRARIETNFQSPHVTSSMLAGDSQQVGTF